MCNAVYALQNMSSDYVEVRNVVAALTPKVCNCNEAFNACQVGNALYGLRGMKSQYLEVRLISPLLLKWKVVSNSLCGLQGIDNEHAEVCDIISALCIKVWNCEMFLGCLEIGISVYGLQGVLNLSGSFTIVDFLFMQLNSLLGSTSNFKSIHCHDLASLSQHVVLFITFPPVMALKDEYAKWDEIQEILIDELTQHKGDDHSLRSGNYKSFLERRVFKVAVKTFAGSSMISSSNGHSFNLSESSLVWRIPTENNPFISNKIINIEVDGEHHKIKEKTKRFCVLRDKYLESKGVVNLRVEAIYLR